jgi:two-component system sensor histidine kinase PilS (NtrC family)
LLPSASSKNEPGQTEMNTTGSDHKIYSSTSWQALKYFNIYRSIISGLFISLYWIGKLPTPLGSFDDRLFSVTAHIYLICSITIFYFIHLQRPRYLLQVTANVFLDIIMLSVLMYASAGISSGFGMLLVIVIAGGSILSTKRVAILFAALATIAVLGEELYAQITHAYPVTNYTHAGFLGITFFITSFLAQALVKRAEEGEALAEQRAYDLQTLAHLNEHIVQRMQSGIIVLDKKYRIHLLNRSAMTLLGLKESAEGKSISDLSPELALSMIQWQQGEGERTVIIRPEGAENILQISFIRLSLERKFEILIFLDDISLMQQRAQEIKLASLGRLTASIAHEIRNPLGAISHAGQLLSESDILVSEDKRLTGIITEHSRRVNKIIENVLSISSRDPAIPVSIDLEEWLEKFIEEFATRYQLSDGSVNLVMQTDNPRALFDPAQLHQIVWNLCENAIRYSKRNPLLEFYCGVRTETGRTYVDIIDHGCGIPDEMVGQLFEPFFTTEIKGSGLGLYIARELCEANRALLNLHSNSPEGCTFRINFAHPDTQGHAIQ